MGQLFKIFWISKQPTKTKSPVEEQLLIINEDSSTKCACSNETVESTDGRIFGKCNHEYKDKFFCYVDKRLQPRCCENGSTILENHCLSYSLCEANAPQPVPLITSQQDMKSNHLKTSNESNQVTPTETKLFGNETQQIVSEISLEWLNANGMKIVWPDQREEVIVLTVSKQFPSLEGACKFEGRPENKNSSFTTTIIGCMDSEETLVNIGLDNQVLELLLMKNGTTLQTITNENFHLSRLERDVGDTGGYLESSQPAADRTGVKDEDLHVPKSLTFPLDLGYDNRLLKHFGGSHSATKSFIQDTVFLSSSFFKRPSTGLPIITFDTLDIKHYDSIDITADQLCESSRKQTESKKLRKGKSTPFVLFVEDMHHRGTGQTTGCAFRGTACNNKDGEAFAIVDMTWKDNSRSGHVQHMAKTMAHEFGHLIGMQDDNVHGKECQNSGLMSYGKPPETWGTCSINDFNIWWRSKGFACNRNKSPPPPSNTPQVIPEPAFDCTALKSKWKCTPSQSCDWFHKVLKAFGKYSKGDRKYQKYKDFYNDRKCDVGHVYCSTNGKFPTYDGDLPKLKRCS